MRTTSFLMGRQYFGKLSIPRGQWVYPTPRDRPEHHSALVASAQSMLSTTQRRRSRSPVVLVSLLSLFAVAGCAIRAEPASPKGTPSATETPLLAVSAGPQVVAVDSASTYPEKVRRTKLSGAHAGSGSDRRAQAGPRHRRLGGKQPVRRTGDGTKTLVLPDAKTFNDASPRSRNSARRLETRPKAKTRRAQRRPTSTSSSTPASSSWRDPASRG